MLPAKRVKASSVFLIMDNLRRLPRCVAVIGAAGGLGQGILRVCRAEGIAFTAIVRSRPERIVDVPRGSQVAVVPSLADRAALTKALSRRRRCTHRARSDADE